MAPFYASPFPAATRVLLAILLLAVRLPVAAQAPAWQSAQAVAAATAAASDNYSTVLATAVDASGKVLLAGFFTNTVAFGGTTLTSLGSADAFVAKFDPTSNQFVWAQRAGSTGNDQATALVVSGTSVYIAGLFSTPTADFGATKLTSAGAQDVFVAKLTDAGSTGSFTWAQRAGGGGTDAAAALATSGTSVYVAGYFSATADFGITTLSSAGAQDLFVAKLTDTGSTSSFTWTQRGGGTEFDTAAALAVSGTSVYVVGSFGNPTASFGATKLTSAGAQDVFVAKLTDAGSTGSFTWAQRAGGLGGDQAVTLAVGNTGSVYVAGYFSALADFGPTTLISAGAQDGFVAKLTDAGSFVWVQQISGADNDQVRALAVSGASVYVAGYFHATANFGAATLTSAGAEDVFVAKLTDAGSTGSFTWAQRGGGTGGDAALALAISNRGGVYVTGSLGSAAASFGPSTITNPSILFALGFLAVLPDLTLAATATGWALVPAQLFPNPARQVTNLRLFPGTAPASLTLTDTQGRVMRHYFILAGSETALSLQGLPPGLYLLYGAGPAQRLMVE